MGAQKHKTDYFGDVPAATYIVDI